MNELTIQVREERGGPVIVIAGKLVGTELGRLQRACLSALQQLNSGELVIDMSDVTYIDSLSIGRLIALNTMAKKDAKYLVLANAQKRVLDTLKTLHIDTLITVR
jgi:anti-anti-sigma factor